MSENDHSIESRRERAEALKGTRESRSFGAKFELREDRDAGTVTVVGWASVTNHDYEVGSYTERIAPGAFKRTLSNDPPPAVVLLAQHEGLPLASTRGGSLSLIEDQRGLRFEALMDGSDPDVDRVTRKVRRGDMTGASFAFKVTDDQWDDTRGFRLIRSVELHGGDVSICSMGANDLASVAVRSAAAEAARQPIPDFTTGAVARLRALGVDIDAYRRAGGVIVKPTRDLLEDDPMDRYKRRLAELRRGA